MLVRSVDNLNLELAICLTVRKDSTRNAVNLDNKIIVKFCQSIDLDIDLDRIRRNLGTNRNNDLNRFIFSANRERRRNIKIIKCYTVFQVKTIFKRYLNIRSITKFNRNNNSRVIFSKSAILIELDINGIWVKLYKTEAFTVKSITDFKFCTNQLTGNIDVTA